ncbi:MAG TPA: hypothetical protein VF101_14095 [Gaiellaceae bacterium]
MLTPLRAAVAGCVVLLAAVLAVAPRPLSSPIRKVANYRADSREPIYNYPLDGSALRRAGKTVSASGRTTYYIRTRPVPQLGHDLIGATLLFFLPARPVPSPREADWVLEYQPDAPLPVRARRTYDLGNGIRLRRLR